ncbi:hypothetical protein DFP74_1419 [Nocardiopsis sp. Huas11]|uniref:hypothetical protein n=1 Tax=Nocardiopsis sp. Huas11 TaxID=2183912 RepID=UPI000F2A3047|nr:hypothetical protein [Nocardiopsis sp. Huas11]RKS05807.1 hypothetical protein DFP74_1419 [Nocardiopsis sp. Huas11]
MSSPRTDPSSGRASPTWVRHSAIDRRLWLVGTAVPMVLLGLPTLGGGIYAGLVQDPAMFGALVLPGLIMGTAMVFHPYLFCEQGIEVGEQGLRLRKKPKWWYRGVALDVPWSVVRGLTVIRHHPGRLDRQVLVIHLERDTGERVSFTWVDIEVPGSVNGLAGYSPGFRIVTIGREAEVDAVIAAALAERPDLRVEETSTNPHKPLPARALNAGEGPEPEASPPQEAPPPQDADLPPPPEPDVRERPEPPPVGVDEFVGHGDVALLSSYALMTGGAVAFLLGLLYPFALVNAWRAGNPVGDIAVGMSGFLFIGLIGLALIGWRLYLLPRQSARQGVRVHPGGITLVRDPMWWSQGLDIELPWADVTGIRFEVRTLTRKQRRMQRSRVIVTLTDFDDTVPLPAWASTFWDTVLDEPTIVLDPMVVADPAFDTYRLIPLLHRARPDLC